jgi:hypothetical protein
MCDEITGYPAIDDWANDFLPHLRPEDQARFRRRFRQQRNAHDQLLHTLRELILGGFLAKRGFNVEYERAINNQTPEWAIVDHDSKAIAIVELTNFHGDSRTEREIKQALSTGGLWVGYLPPSGDRLYDRLREKSAKYKDLANEIDVPYIVAVEIELSTTVNGEELSDILHNPEYGLFNLYPEVSGLVAFADGSGYYMHYRPNPNAIRPFEIPEGSPTE